jgi:hypothetical protein
MTRNLGLMNCERCNEVIVKTAQNQKCCKKCYKLKCHEKSSEYQKRYRSKHPEIKAKNKEAQSKYRKKKRDVLNKKCQYCDKPLKVWERKMCRKCYKSIYKKDYLKMFYLYKKYGGNVKKVLERDNYECQNPTCKSKEKLRIHHKDGNKSNNNSKNLLTLCNSCHSILEWFYSALLKIRKYPFLFKLVKEKENYKARIEGVKV